ncbi:MAG: DNA alkylation repair protein [Candidatus Peregrinibacteria bacterium]|nr:DNA alkylation repair protein [Candidatus Peregrinibacteria bacterium]
MEIIKELQKLASPEKAKFADRFFKTGKGEYGKGDHFLGIVVPETRKISKKYKNISLPKIETLLDNKFHEARLCALLILVQKFPKEPEKIYKFYLKNSAKINNWDLVDSSADKIIGAYLYSKPSQKTILYKLVKSKNIWERRIAILSTFYFIRKNEFDDALKISELLLNDSHDLIHKAVGWMLREIGKRDIASEEAFLKKFASKMPRTMLRYAIERFPEAKRLSYLKTKQTHD